ncbi:MAG TPA: glycine oxidase ThiO [Candidatus Acidoferrum sp.]|nr:glycine oxidase ThiO [Candidatus Acidoferrum sp.]
MTRPDIAIVGGGLLGRCLAWRASKAGARVALYDAGSSQGEGSAAWAAAGMIAPTAEAVDGNAQIASMGQHSLALWPLWLAELPVQVFYRDSGTILLWHREDAGEAVRTERMLAARHPHASLKRLNSAGVADLEPALGTRFPRALYIADDAQVDNRAFLRAVAIALEEARVECHWETFVVHGTLPDAGIVVDCRGMGAIRDWPKLRGVRGEIVRLHAPEIELQHMLRLLHPRYPVYIVPRAEGRLIVGATSIESDDRSSVSVRGALELLTSAFSVLPALAEARILEFNTQVRPALPDHLPAFHFDRDRKKLSINGLYRHGFLLTPTIVEEVLALLSLVGESAGRWPCLRGNRSVTHSADIQDSCEISACS